MKDASLPKEDVTKLYQELVLIVRRMFLVCKLVHADLSEYNIMYHEGHLWIIDVSQSVEHDHPAAFDFLRNDIKNVEDFFGRLGVTCLGLRRCFEFVIKEKLTEEDGISDEDVLVRMCAEKDEGNDDDEEVESQEDQTLTANGAKTSQKTTKSKSKVEDAEHEDSVFMHSFIPRTLNEVFDPERDVEKHKRGDELIYADSIGLVPTKKSDNKDESTPEPSGTERAIEDGASVAAPNKSINNADHNGDGKNEMEEISEEDGSEGSGGEERDSEDEDDENTPEGFVERKPRGHRHEDKEAKKVGFALSL